MNQMNQTNDEKIIDDADRIQLSDDIVSLFSTIPDQDTMAFIIECLSMTDEKFRVAWPQLRELMTKIFNSEKFQNDQKVQMLAYGEIPQNMVADERKQYKKVIAILKAEEELIPEKIAFIELILNSCCDVHEMLASCNRISVPVKICKLNSDANIPEYAHDTDAGCDVFAVKETKIEPGQTTIVKTGIAVGIPAGYEIQVRPRSGLSLKSKLRIANAPGTIDADYRGEIGIIMTNTGDTPYIIDKGMKIAQLVIAPTPIIKWNVVKTVEELGTTSRGEGGFGSTGERAASES